MSCYDIVLCMLDAVIVARSVPEVAEVAFFAGEPNPDEIVLFKEA